MRIISGQYRSRLLKATPPEGIRPTSDKLRETLFNILGGKVIDSTLLDGCAGMGGIGLEALSRGAAYVYFVDRSRKACRVIRENLDTLQIREGFKILESDLTKALKSFLPAGVVFDIVFIDPPYERDDLYQRALEIFASGPLLAADGVLIFEHSRRVSMPESMDGLGRTRSLIQGDSILSFYRRQCDKESNIPRVL